MTERTAVKRTVDWLWARESQLRSNPVLAGSAFAAMLIELNVAVIWLNALTRVALLRGSFRLGGGGDPEPPHRHRWPGGREPRSSHGGSGRRHRACVPCAAPLLAECGSGPPGAQGCSRDRRGAQRLLAVAAPPHEGCSHFVQGMELSRRGQPDEVCVWGSNGRGIVAVSWIDAVGPAVPVANGPPLGGPSETSGLVYASPGLDPRQTVSGCVRQVTARVWEVTDGGETCPLGFQFVTRG